MKVAQSRMNVLRESNTFLLQLAQSKGLFIMCGSIECLVPKTLHTRSGLNLRWQYKNRDILLNEEGIYFLCLKKRKPN